jgi:hypothetical protein
LGKLFDRPGKGIDAHKFWDGVSGGGKELVIKVNVTAEIAVKSKKWARGAEMIAWVASISCLVIVPNIALSSVTRFKGVRDPVPNWCLELMSLRVTLPRLVQMAEWRSCSSKFLDAME